MIMKINNNAYRKLLCKKTDSMFIKKFCINY